jgi:hypothetical protein
LVEGPGDAVFFETLRRRFRDRGQHPMLARLAVTAVGGKTAFAPWWKLLSAYGRPGDRPIRWTSVMDSDAAALEGTERALLRGLRDAAIEVPGAIRDAIIALGDSPWNQPDLRREAAAALNSALVTVAGVRLFSVDAEYATFGGLAATDAARVARVLEAPIPTNDVILTLARRAGSKVGTGRCADGAKKQPFLRGKLADAIPLDELPDEVKACMRDWFLLVLPTNQLPVELQQ